MTLAKVDIEAVIQTIGIFTISIIVQTDSYVRSSVPDRIPDLKSSGKLSNLLFLLFGSDLNINYEMP